MRIIHILRYPDLHPVISNCLLGQVGVLQIDAHLSVVDRSENDVYRLLDTLTALAENVRKEECSSCSTGRTQRSAQRIRIGRRVLALLIVVRVLGVFPKSKTRRPWAPRRRRSRNVILTE